MRFNPKARIDQSGVEDRGGRGGGGGGGLGGGGLGGLPIPSGKLGGGTIVVIILYVVFQLIAGNSVIPGTGGSSATDTSAATGSSSCKTGADANADMDCAIGLFTTSIQSYWKGALSEQTRVTYEPIKTIKYSGQTDSGCGTAQSAMGPFYCPNDKRVYIDKSFMRQMLEGELGAKGGPFALGYVLAHEYGHHIEDELGILGRMQSRQGATSDSVRVELMADCLAGTWAKYATQTTDAQGNTIITDLTKDDVARAIDAARAVGDDRIQKESTGRIDQEAWTHGSSAERVHWFGVGMDRGTIAACQDVITTNDLDG